MAKFCTRCNREFTDVVRSCPEHGRRLLRFRDERLRPGDMVDDRFVVLNRIGAGGTGDVYRARSLLSQRVVALKVLRRDEARARLRFANEARVLAKLSHPNVVAAGEVQESAEGRLYLVMPLVQGRTLRQILTKDAPLGPLRAARLAAQLAGGLAAMHEVGVAHLDLKPNNILVGRALDNREVLTIVDFDIAVDLSGDETEPHRAGRIKGAGTPGYIAPEQAAGEDADTRADLYGLGILLREMLTGERLFAYDDARAALDTVRHAKVRPIHESHPVLRVPELLCDLVLELLSEDPADRPAIERVQQVLADIVGEEADAAQVSAEEGEVEPLPLVEPRATWHLRVGAGLGRVRGAVGRLYRSVLRAPPEVAQVAEVPLEGSDCSHNPAAPEGASV